MAHNHFKCDYFFSQTDYYCFWNFTWCEYVMCLWRIGLVSPIFSLTASTNKRLSRLAQVPFLLVFLSSNWTWSEYKMRYLSFFYSIRDSSAFSFIAFSSSLSCSPFWPLFVAEFYCLIFFGKRCEEKMFLLRVYCYIIEGSTWRWRRKQLKLYIIKAHPPG